MRPNLLLPHTSVCSLGLRGFLEEGGRCDCVASVSPFSCLPAVVVLSPVCPDSEIPSLSHTRILLKSKETENNAFSGKSVDLSLSPLCVSWGLEIAPCWGLPLAGSWPRASRLP